MLSCLQQVIKHRSKANRQNDTNNIDNQFVRTSSHFFQSLLHTAVHTGYSIIDAVNLATAQYN